MFSRYDELEAKAVAAKLSKLHLERGQKKNDTVVVDGTVDNGTSPSDTTSTDASGNEEKENQSKTGKTGV